jgi:hypothetical protein
VLQLADGDTLDLRVAPVAKRLTTYAAMGRFGNLFPVAGEPDLRLTWRASEVVRLWLTNTASTGSST